MVSPLERAAVVGSTGLDRSDDVAGREFRSKYVTTVGPGQGVHPLGA
jgi:hypothetical protein